MVEKLLRARGGCLGTGGRRRTWHDCDKPRLAVSQAQPGMSEWGNPARCIIGSSFRGRTPTVCRHAVSGTFNSPPGVLFHLSLTVLLHYRSLEVFSLGKWSSQLPTGFHVSRGTQGHRQGRSCSFAYEAVTLCGGPFQGPSARARFGDSPARYTVRPACVLQPRQGIGPCAVTFPAGLGCSPFARRY